MWISGRMIEMLFSKKSKSKDLVLMHYEGLQGFSQDFPCSLVLDEGAIKISKVKPDLTATLPLNQIQGIDFMPEVNFMAQYHNFPANTAKMGTKFFYIIKYTSSQGEAKHVAFWDVGNKADSFMDEIRTRIAPENYTL